MKKSHRNLQATKKQFPQTQESMNTKVRFGQEYEAENPFALPSYFGGVKLPGMPKPGRSVPAFNIQDLPRVLSFDDEIFNSPEARAESVPNSVINLMQREIKNKKVAAEERLKKIRSKPGGTVPVAQHKKTYSRPAYNEKNDFDSDLNETFMSNSDRIRQELLGVQFGMHKEVQKGIGFGFKIPGAGLPFKKPYTPARIEEIFDNEDELNQASPQIKSSPLAFKQARTQNKPVEDIQNKISENPKKSKEYEKVSLKQPNSTNLKSVKLPKLGGRNFVSAKLQFPKPVLKSDTNKPNPLNTAYRTKSMVNDKLAELSQHFRESLQISPRDLQNNNPKTREPSFDYEKHQEKKSIPIDILEEKSILFSRRGTQFAQMKPDAQATKPKSILTKKKKPSSKTDFSGVIQLRSLLEANSPKVFNKQEQQTHEPQVRFNVASQDGPNSGLTKQSSAVSIGTSTRIPQEAYNQKLGKSVNNMNDVAKVANSLGTMVTRAAASNSGKSSNISNTGQKVTAAEIGKQLGLQFDMEAILSAKSPLEQKKQMLKLAEELKRRANNVGPPNINTFPSESEAEEDSSSPKVNVWKPPSQRKQTFSTLTSPMFNSGIQANVPGTGIQTETNLGNKTGHYQMPEIKFTRDMSIEDQNKLKELRKMQHTWQYVERGHDASESY